MQKGSGGGMKEIDRMRKRNLMKKLEREGLIADSMDVRMSLVKKIYQKEITIEQSRAELKRIRRNAKKHGQTTRDRVWAQG